MTYTWPQTMSEAQMERSERTEKADRGMEAQVCMEIYS